MATKNRKQKKAENQESVPNVADIVETTEAEATAQTDKVKTKGTLLQKRQKKGRRLHDAVETTEKTQGDEKGIIYVGHIPYGFVEEGLKEYFSQYGDITNLKLVRSKKTGRSKGYAFIQFAYKEVAKIAAKTVNGYLMYGKQLVCKVLEDNNMARFKNADKQFKYIPFSKLFASKYNSDKNAGELKESVKHLLKSEEKRRKKLESLGISYTFPGFKALVEKTSE